MITTTVLIMIITINNNNSNNNEDNYNNNNNLFNSINSDSKLTSAFTRSGILKLRNPYLYWLLFSLSHSFDYPSYFFNKL